MYFERLFTVDDVGWPLLAVVFSAGVSFFFSLHKLALQMYSKVKLAEAFKRANLENKTDEIAEKQENMLLCCLLFWTVFTSLTFISLLWLAKASSLDTGFSAYIWIFIASVVITLFNLIVPFAWAKYSGESILIRTYKLLFFLNFLISPLAGIFKLNDVIVKRLSGYADATPQDQQEDFLSVVEEQMMEGVVDQVEQKMIEHVLELDETAVDEVMTPRTDVIAIDIKSSFRAVIETITSAGHSRIPVYEDNIDKIVGFVYAKDMLKFFGENTDDFDLGALLRQAYFVPETKILSVLLNEFKAKNLHIAVVLDEYGGTAGLVTIEDILEEVVGEINDEYEMPEPENIKIIDDKTADVDARTNIDDINSELDINLPEDDDYDTVGGFVFSHLGYIPKVDETFEYDNLKFVVTEADQRSIKRLNISKLNPQDS